MRPSVLIAGPCSAESREQVLATAQELAALGPLTAFRAGVWKPRSRPGCFEGVGSEALGWLAEVREKFALRVCTEVYDASSAKECIEAGLDMVWIGARTSANPFLVQEIASALRGSGATVLVKNPVSQDLSLWVGAVERLQREGIGDIIAVHRGFSNASQTQYRNDPCWNIALDLKARFPSVPLVCDPSHMAGDATKVPELSQRAIDLGYEGLMLEVHCEPAQALCDAKQQLSPAQAASLLEGLHLSTPSEGFKSELATLRSRIDCIDEQILRLLSQRMEVSSEIGELKKKEKISAVQNARWEEVLSRLESLAPEYSLSPEMVRKIYDNIHEGSIALQNSIIVDDEKI